MASEPKAPTDRFLVLKPPVAAILNAWFTASKRGIPAAQRLRRAARVRETYTVVMILTTLVDLYLYPSLESEDISMFVSFRR